MRKLKPREGKSLPKSIQTISAESELEFGILTLRPAHCKSLGTLPKILEPCKAPPFITSLFYSLLELLTQVMPLSKSPPNTNTVRPGIKTKAACGVGLSRTRLRVLARQSLFLEACFCDLESVRSEAFVGILFRLGETHPSLEILLG